MCGELEAAKRVCRDATDDRSVSTWVGNIKQKSVRKTLQMFWSKISKAREGQSEEDLVEEEIVQQDPSM